ncbi:hypothetical protein LguiA_029984 [Lonicera macranthoides]
MRLFGVDISTSVSASPSSSAAAELSLLVGDSTMSKSSASASASSSTAVDPSLLVGGSTMSRSSASASASAYGSAAADPSLLVGEYEVFLSFCGQDTRYGFTDFLYTSLNDVGIRTFRDSESLHVSEEIGPELLKAITDSKISIPIFSKNYASKKWCLLELAHMVECLKNRGQMIFPIFYDVDPDDVQHQHGSYEEAFCQHRKRRYDQKVIQEWKNALKKVGQLKGLELKKETGGHEGELVKIIKNKVLEFLKQNNKHEDLDLVGMPSRIKKMEELLNIHSDGVRFIGIYGMGGLGKTTIANLIYNKYQHHFECHSFLKDVRETESCNGIVHLQNQLRSDILKTKISDIDDYNEGIKKIKDAVHEKKVLIVLDDVSEKSQIDRLAGSWKWFGAQARIIITIRNEEVLRALEHTCHKDGHPEVCGSYKPDFLDNDDSLELFSKYAFMNKSPQEGYEIPSQNIVSTAGGLPLVLVVTGSSLYGETNKDLWDEKFKELKNIPAEKVQEKLRLSYDPLSDAQKEIFLDIACLFIGESKINPCYMWDDCGFYPRNVLNILVRKSLITVEDNDILGMHDQLRDLGRHIAREGKSDEWGRWSRLWDHDKAFEVYSTSQGTEKVKAFCLDLRLSRGSNWALSRFAPDRTNLRHLEMRVEYFTSVDNEKPSKEFRKRWDAGRIDIFWPANVLLKSFVSPFSSYE